MQSYRTIGVPEAIDVLEGRLSVKEFTERVIRQTWQLARRQMSWFRRDPSIHWLRVTDRSATAVADEIVQRLTEQEGP